MPDSPAPRPGVYALRIIAGAAVLVVLVAGRSVLVPLAFGVLLAVLLAPVVARLRRWRVPAPIAAAVAVVASLALFVLIVLALEPPLQSLAALAPQGIAAARQRIDALRAPLERLGRKLEQEPARPPGRHTTPTLPPTANAGNAANGAPATNAPAAGGAAESGAAAAAKTDSAIARVAAGPTGARPTTAGPPTAGPTAASPTRSAPAGADGDSTAARLQSRILPLAERVFGSTAALLGQLIEVMLLALYLLAGAPRWEHVFTRMARTSRAKQTLAATLPEMRQVVTRYVVATLLINLSQGVLIALTMWALGLPAPLLWGVLTSLLEMIPYFGGFVMVALLAVAGLATGGTLVHALLAPGLYLTVTTLQNNLVSPPAYGRQLKLNAAAILVATAVGYAVWGVGGAVLAVPAVAALRVVATHVDALAPLAVLLEGSGSSSPDRTDRAHAHG